MRPPWWNRSAWFAMRRSRRQAWLRWLHYGGPEPACYRHCPAACHGWMVQYRPTHVRVSGLPRVGTVNPEKKRISATASRQHPSP